MFPLLKVQVQDKRSRQSSTAVVVINTKATVDEPLEFDLSTDTFELGNNDEVLQLKLKYDHSDQIVYNVSDNPFVVIDPISGKLFKKSNVPNVLNGNVIVSVRKISESPDESVKKTLRFFLPSSSASSQHR